jgi:hypothetical protein
MPGKYEVRVTVRIKDGMDDKYIKVPSKDTVKVNGKSAKLKEVTDDKKQAVVVYTFNIEDSRTDHMHCYCGGYIENTGDHTAHQTVAYQPWPEDGKISYKNGEAYIICTLDQNGPQRYSIKISEINKDANGSKCFMVKVADPKLIEKTGGIVQGMSGSPIIQNGKLVGAVTHVLINDPTTGYGIFIENMLNAAQMPMAKAS